ncbi:MAG: DUF554 domain-containing protein [Lachnospiraceae bacterium]
MAGIGTVINTAAVLVGATVGILIKGGLPKRFQDTVTGAIGLCTIFIGISGAMGGLLEVMDGALTTKDTMMMIGSLILGALVGEGIDIEKRLENLGEWCKARVSGDQDKTGSFVEAFVTSSLLFCVGAMAIVGSLEDGLNHNYDILMAKSVMDGVMAIVLTASLGIGVYFSVVPIIIYQGGVTLLAGFVRPYLNEMVIGRMSFVGSILIFALGINLLFGKKVKIGNLLPAMFFPLVLQFVL